MDIQGMRRGEFGYFYRGYYIERCPNNQWNIWSVPNPALFSELFCDGGELIDEGLASLKQAGREIDSYLEGK